MDIRNWFAPKTASSKSSSNVSQKDKKTEKESIKKEVKQKKRRVIESDSDEDPIPTTIKKEPSTVKSPKEKSLNKIPEKKKEVSASDFFGSGPIARTQKDQAPARKKLKEDKIHEDDDFAATLTQLDKQKKPENVKTNGEKKHKVQDNDKTVSSKSPPKAQDHSEETTSKKDSKSSNKDKKTSKKKSKYGDGVEVEIVPAAKKTVTKVVVDEKPAAKKPRNSGAANYASYLNRQGPQSLGSKEMPEGEEDCLAGLTFVVTGVLESFERDEIKNMIEGHGGKIMTTLSKNTKYIVIGRDAGASKLEKAEKFGTKQLDEDGLLDLIRTLPGKPGSAKKKPKDEKKSTNSNKTSSSGNTSVLASSVEDDFEMDCDESIFSEKELSFCEEVSAADVKKSASSKTEEPKPSTFVKASEHTEPKKEIKVSPAKTKNTSVSPAKTKDTNESSAKTKDTNESSAKTKDTAVLPASTPSYMWVDKYKPTNLKQIIGQQGENSNAKKLLRWLLNWSKSRKLNKKPFPGRFNAGDDGSAYKAALLSGPPGIGKTTTAVLVCKEAGFDFFELNASDTRSKKNLQQRVSQLLGNQTLSDCFKGSEEVSGKVSKNHVIVMDEVDGMAGNEDRGGVGELISFIKASKVPIICICNDRNHTKIRSLANHCFDLRFQRPRLEQIKSAMMSIAYKEHLKVSPEALQDVIVASNQDLRQVLHNMAMWSAKTKGLNAEQTKKDAGKSTKHIKMGPFDVLREVFEIANNPKATLNDKSDLFFHDYSIAPLFVQENYVHVVPTAANGDKKKHLRLLSEAADSICMGDVIDKSIRSQMNWGLLPTQAMFASVIPGEVMRGHMRQMVNFPAWLGKNSNRGHMDRVLQELHIHMRMRVSGNKTDVALDYLPLLKRSLTLPLIEKGVEGVPDSLKTMEEYFLLREDFDSIIDLSLWSTQKDPRTQIETKVKSAFTRAYNKECGKNPYAVTNVKKKKSSPVESMGGEEEEESEEEEDDSIEKDAMIKVKKPTKKAAAEPSTSKEKKTTKKGKSK